jgi:hypothetical protein
MGLERLIDVANVSSKAEIRDTDFNTPEIGTVVYFFK